MASAEKIARYYNANTRRFLRYGGSGDVAAIHRAIWAPTVKNRREAFQFLNGLVADAIQPLMEGNHKTLRILDLGCGVGGTAISLHRLLGVEVTGISISESQVQEARRRTSSLDGADHLHFVSGNFDAMPELGEFDGVYAIESFVHSQNPENFLRGVHRQLKQRGRLIICDDFLHPSPPPAATAWIERFRRGWQINHLLSRDELVSLASSQGFKLLDARDLSAFVRPFPWPILTLMAWVTRLPFAGAYWQNLAGGTALQVCLKRSYTQYHALVLEKT